MLVGIDIGGTKTGILAVSGSKRLTEAMPTAEWRTRTDPAADASALLAAVTRLAGAAAPRILVVGAHGCDTDAASRGFQQHLAGHFTGTVLVLNDAELLLAAAGKQEGIAVVSGTGSIAVARGEGRRMITSGGWGWYIGDEGGAGGLVREAARAVCGSIDAGAPLERLGQGFLRTLAIDHPIEIGRALSERGGAGIAGFAPLVFEAADAGSRLAIEVVAEGGEALATLTVRVLGKGASGTDVVTGGGVIARQPRLFEAFRRALSAMAPQMALSLVTAPPVEGAIALAERLQAGERPRHLPLPHVAGRGVDEADWRAA